MWDKQQTHTQKKKINDKSKSTEKNDNIPKKFTLKDENNNTKFYSFHRKSGDNNDLRFMERNCKGTVQFNIITKK